MSAYTHPVSKDDEIELVKKNLARMEAQGQSLFSPDRRPTVSSGSMSNGSKRKHAAAEPSGTWSEDDESVFDVIGQTNSW